MTISALTKITGLSCSTFAKAYIRVLLAEHGYAQNDSVTVIPKGKKNDSSAIILEKEGRIAELTARNAELVEKCELQQGDCFYMMQR